MINAAGVERSRDRRLGTRPVNVFVAEKGNGYMSDIAAWVVEAAELTGWEARLITDRLPAADGSINLVVAPHEFFLIFPASGRELARAAAASVCVCTEQPGTRWYRSSLEACRRAIHVLDINPQGVEAMSRAGISVSHMPLGGVPSMFADPAEPHPSRPIDVLFMGGIDDRRAAALADLAPRLYRYRSDIRLFRFDRPVSGSTPGLVFGTDKLRLLASSKVLVNIHRDRTGIDSRLAGQPHYFEWARVIETMASGCVVLSEPAEGYEPLVPGEHFVMAELEEFGEVLEALLRDPERMARISDSARRMVASELRLERSLDPLLHELDARPPARRPSVRSLAVPWHVPREMAGKPTFAAIQPFRPFAGIRRSAKDAILAERRLLRRIDRAACMLRHGTEQRVQKPQTPAFHDTRPEVSVVVSAYNCRDFIIETLETIARSEGVPFEVLVVEDGSTDDTRAILQQFLRRRPELPLALLQKEVNEGLPAARNTGFAEARGEFVMVMDADNHLYPTCLGRLLEALRLEPDAAAAYSILEEFGDSRGLRSALAWDPERLLPVNYIDAQALWRRSAWFELGGYRTEDDIHGLEDWELWLRLARAGGRAVLVPEILGRYHVRRDSMTSIMALAAADAAAAVHARQGTTAISS